MTTTLPDQAVKDLLDFYETSRHLSFSFLMDVLRANGYRIHKTYNESENELERYAIAFDVIGYKSISLTVTRGENDSAVISGVVYCNE